MKRAIALMSGGIDSAVAAVHFYHLEKPDEMYCAWFDYGQRHVTEFDYAKKLCEYYKWKIRIISIPYIPAESALTNKDGDLNKMTRAGLPGSFVPGRNIVMLSLASAYAYDREAKYIVGGWNRVDYPGYPDCRPIFLHHMNMALNSGLGLEKKEKIHIYAPLIDLTKEEIILRGCNLGVPLEFTWSCYEGKDKPCGTCSSCKFRAEGFKRLNLKDPLLK